ncbi:MAG: GTPase [Planctomycetota bacterium]
MISKRANYFSITTPQGLGGIGVVELFGPDARKIVGRIFRPTRSNTKADKQTSQSVIPVQVRPEDSLSEGKTGIHQFLDSCLPDSVIQAGFHRNDRMRQGKIYLGNILDHERIIDEVIIHFTPDKHSLTKSDTVEINAHGGIMSCRLIGDLLKRLGVRELSQAQVITLAHKRGRIDKIQAQALEYLLEARTPLSASVLLDQYNGALSKALKSKKNLSTLRESARFGIALTHPRRILILGRPNVGKSTLFNALLGQDRALTHHLPGTTRDTIEDFLAIDGFPFVLVDTAGLRDKTSDSIEKVGIVYTKKEIPKADVILLVVEKEEINPLPQGHKDTKKKSPWFYDTIKLPPKSKRPIIIVVNKADLYPKIRPEVIGTPLRLRNQQSTIRNPIVFVSALRRTGIDKLRKEIPKTLRLDKFRHRPGAPVIFTKRQMALIH